MRLNVSIHSFALAIMMFFMPAFSYSQIAVSIRIAPPALPVYEQPLCPGDGYIWTPGYWAWSDDFDDYYWVPGTWVPAPEVGFLWTPGYWAWSDAGFVFYEGYWGPTIGFYGGINYGFGYFGEGYEGGRWDHDRFFYNQAVSNVNVTQIHNVYNTTVINNYTVNRVSYNGGEGGINARPTPAQEAAARERHIPPVAAQTQHAQAARSNQQLRASVNQGKPPVAATPKPGAFNDRAVVAAKAAGAPYKPAKSNENQAQNNGSPPRAGSSSMLSPGNSGNVAPAPANVVHPNDLPPIDRSSLPNTGNSNLDRKYQKQQEKLFAKQGQERQKLQQQQDKEHQQLANKNGDASRMQQLEQKHQQQTQQLQQRHEQQRQQLQQKVQPPDRQR